MSLVNLLKLIVMALRIIHLTKACLQIRPVHTSAISNGLFDFLCKFIYLYANYLLVN